MARKKTRPQAVFRRPTAAAEKSGGKSRRPEPPRISGRWLLSAMALTFAAAVFCGWGALCLLFWQGSWQLLYHPAGAIARTPAGAGIAFDSVGFAAADDGTPRLSGWWVPAPPGAQFDRYTVLYLHGQDGNIGDTVDAIGRLHTAGANVLAFDYRGYGQSQFARPSEADWRQDAEWALQYLTATRHIGANTIVLDGSGLGANLALELAALHPELPGVIVDSPIENPMNSVFSDARARMVPAHLLARDRYDLDGPAAAIRIPTLWLGWTTRPGLGGGPAEPEAFTKIAARKMLVWLDASKAGNEQYADALSRWLDDLPQH
jgi:pimeloyl-ACP methyl ester carboxylesterase